MAAIVSLAAPSLASSLAASLPHCWSSSCFAWRRILARSPIQGDIKFISDTNGRVADQHLSRIERSRSKELDGITGMWRHWRGLLRFTFMTLEECGVEERAICIWVMSSNSQPLWDDVVFVFNFFFSLSTHGPLFLIVFGAEVSGFSLFDTQPSGWGWFAS